jgi:hypothetical protein
MKHAALGIGIIMASLEKVAIAPREDLLRAALDLVRKDEARLHYTVKNNLVFITIFAKELPFKQYSRSFTIPNMVGDAKKYLIDYTEDLKDLMNGKIAYDYYDMAELAGTWTLDSLLYMEEVLLAYKKSDKTIEHLDWQILEEGWLLVETYDPYGYYKFPLCVLDLIRVVKRRESEEGRKYTQKLQERDKSTNS